MDRNSTIIISKNLYVRQIGYFLNQPVPLVQDVARNVALGAAV